MVGRSLSGRVVTSKRQLGDCHDLGGCKVGGLNCEDAAQIIAFQESNVLAVDSFSWESQRSNVPPILAGNGSPIWPVTCLEPLK